MYGSLLNSLIRESSMIIIREEPALQRPSALEYLSQRACPTSQTVRATQYTVDRLAFVNCQARIQVKNPKS